MTVKNRLVKIASSLTAAAGNPGTLYNTGNVIGFAGGITEAVIAATQNPAAQSAGDGVQNFLVGSPAAAFLTAASAIFFVSGQRYDKAWQSLTPPNLKYKRQGDVLSAVGATALAAGLSLQGQPFMALTSGAMHAGGKLMAALPMAKQFRIGAQAMSVPQLGSYVAAASRLPAIVELAGIIADKASHMPPNTPTQLVMPMVMSACYLVWTKADIALMPPQAQTAILKAPQRAAKAAIRAIQQRLPR